MLNQEQLQAATNAAKSWFGLIQKKYPELMQPVYNRAYLVLSLPGGQTGIDSPPAQILNELPAMVVDDVIKTRALSLLAHQLDAIVNSETERLKKQFDQLVPQLKYHEECLVEIRFNDLKYDLVWKLQADDLVDRNLTPQTKASIRIVLGILGHFKT